MTELLFGMATLNFDWDDVSSDDVIVVKALRLLDSAFGSGRVWYRLSSSGTGLHVMVAELVPIDDAYDLRLVPVDFDEQLVLEWRQKLMDDPYGLECDGRFRADRERLSHGFRIGRIFGTKNLATSGRWNCFVEP